MKLIKRLDVLAKEAKKDIADVVANNNGRVVLNPPMEAYYLTSDGGFSGDGLALIEDESCTITFVEDGGDEYDYDYDYDFEEDEDGIVSAYCYGLDDLQMETLFRLADRLKGCSNHYEDKFKDIYNEAEGIFNSVDGIVCLNNQVSVSLEDMSNCKWYTSEIVSVSEGGIITDKDGVEYDTSEESMFDYEYVEIADELLASLNL